MAKKKEISKNPITNSIYERFNSEHWSMMDQRIKPVSEEFIDALCAYIKKEAQKDDCIVFQDIFNAKGILEENVDFWAEKFPQLKSAMNFAKQAIFSRREKMCMNNQGSFQTYAFTSWLYSDKVKKMHIEKAALAKVEKNPDHTIKVEVSTVENSPLVPDKGEGDD